MSQIENFNRLTIMKSTFYVCLSLISMMLLFSCVKEQPFVVDGMSPIYYAFDDASSIKSLPPTKIESAGKIVGYKNLLFINEKNSGLHVINNIDPANPVTIHFLQIPGNNEFVILDDVLYADNGRHMWVIDIADLSTITVVDVIKNVYEYERKELYPPNYKGWFVCFDSNVGPLLGWKNEKITNPTCEIK